MTRAAEAFAATATTTVGGILCTMAGGLMLLATRGQADDSGPKKPPAADRPNVILCMTDDQGWGDVSDNGLKQIETPALDAMAAAGVRFFN
jgi:hypothetical protein